MEDKITIIEGPTPEFEEINDGWLMGQNEGPYPFELALTRLRTFNGEGLVERCYHAWQHQHPMYLHYRDMIGLERKASIIAARAVDTEDGDMLLLRRTHNRSISPSSVSTARAAMMNALRSRPIISR